MMSKGFSAFMPKSTAFLLSLWLALLVAPALGRGGKAIESNPERDKALAEADKKAFEENMATYNEKVKPFMEKHCFGCHGPKKQKGDINLVLLDPDMKDSPSAARWAVVRDQLENGDMPPDGLARLLASTEAILGIFTISLFIFVFCRRVVR